MLWHGSRVTNYIGILSEGLKIAPEDAPVSGYMFGKGVYFSDVPSKAANYCHATRRNPEGLLLLCQVALGEAFEVFSARALKQPPLYHHSVLFRLDLLSFRLRESGSTFPAALGHASSMASTNSRRVPLKRISLQ